MIRNCASLCATTLRWRPSANVPMNSTGAPFLQRITTQSRQTRGNSYRIASQTATWISRWWIKIRQCFSKINSVNKESWRDNKLTLIEHVNHVCKAAHCYVRVLRHVRKYVSEDVIKSLVGARLNYCNAVFYGTSGTNIDKLQRVQNTLHVFSERAQ